MAICYLCSDALIMANCSLEHLFPNSIGGRLKSDMLLCKTCNESTGRLHDPEFANLLASKYNIIRERGSVRNEIGIDRQTGREVVIKPGYQVDYLHPEIKSISEDQR